MIPGHYPGALTVLQIWNLHLLEGNFHDPDYPVEELRCDCGQQLNTAMHMIQKAGKGALVYLRQEGRGIGLHNKLKAYKLQDEGYDTVEANEMLGLPVDRRDYGVGAHILRDLGLRTLRILTNNPKKVSRLEVYGIKIAEQLRLEIRPNSHNIAYLRTKRQKLGHDLEQV